MWLQLSCTWHAGQNLQRSANLALTVCLRSPPTCFRLFACISSGCSLQPTALLVVSAAFICATPRVAAGTCSYWSSFGRLPWQNALCCAVVRVVGALHLAQVWLMSWLQAPCSPWQLSCTLLEFVCSACGRCPASMPLCLADAWLQEPCAFRLCVVVVFQTGRSRCRGVVPVLVACLRCHTAALLHGAAASMAAADRPGCTLAFMLCRALCF